MNLQSIIEKSKDIFPYIREIRRQIHQNPELSFKEFETAALIREKLTELGIEYQVLAETGTVALIGSGSPCVALRADIDALPIIEETGLEFASKNLGVMHACGHDMHASMLLAAAKIFKENESELKGTVKLIFQPERKNCPVVLKL